MDEFTTRGDRNRALGWEMKDPSSADNSGELLAARSFGHTGFTGTSVWIDPSQDVFVVLLTNRVMAPRHPRSIAALKGIRGQVADAAVRLRWYACRIEQMVSEDRVCVDGPAR
jgi:CubicO group peptidase (beta-lactamase class C family)